MLHAARQKEDVPAAAVRLWEQVAAQIISIIGEGGFDSLYARSVFLVQSTYPWLAASSVLPQKDHRFTPLKTSFEGQSPALTLEANSLLLITFTDILASLVGESLTVRILDSAWDHDGQINAGEEFKK